jgi:purine-binding chemotaxis protein CheW
MPVAERVVAGKYLTFTLGAETYGLEVLKVREIIRLPSITPVPQMPSHILGVMNLRGKIIPVLDLHIRFGLPNQAATERTCVVVVQAKTGNSAETLMGLVVDDVQEVMGISEAEIEETPEFGSSFSTDYLVGVAKLKGKVALLLDIARVLATESGGSMGTLLGDGHSPSSEAGVATK